MVTLKEYVTTEYEKLCFPFISLSVFVDNLLDQVSPLIFMQVFTAPLITLFAHTTVKPVLSGHPRGMVK